MVDFVQKMLHQYHLQNLCFQIYCFQFCHQHVGSHRPYPCHFTSLNLSTIHTDLSCLFNVKWIIQNQNSIQPLPKVCQFFINSTLVFDTLFMMHSSYRISPNISTLSNMSTPSFWTKKIYYVLN